MSNPNPELEPLDDEMLAEYDFSGGVRGKHHEAYRQGHTVTVHQADGTTIVQTFPPTDAIVLLDPDVRAYFPDSAAVNQALRTLISLFPQT
jgi:ATP-dependent RNA circularization protein (DNA/RNA ligase family)